MSRLFDLIDSAPTSAFIAGGITVLLALAIADRALAYRWAKGK